MIMQEESATLAGNNIILFPENITKESMIKVII